MELPVYIFDFELERNPLHPSALLLKFLRSLVEQITNTIQKPQVWTEYLFRSSSKDVYSEDDNEDSLEKLHLARWIVFPGLPLR
jgi:hypothetical protein